LTPEEATEFAAEPELRDILRLRGWDGLAKDPDWQGPEIRSYTALLSTYLPRIGVQT
jgi:predicted HD phosphohydrolase